MKKILLIICSVIVSNISLSGQKNELITVKAGTRLMDYFPVAERYLYSEFTTGRILLNNGNYSDRQLNYNKMAGEIEFIQARDTLSIANKKDIRLVLIAQDTFYYDRGYIEQLRGGKIKVGLKQYVELKEEQSKDSYGTSSAGSATTSVGSLPLDGNFYKFTANKDLIFKRTLQYYIATPASSFVLCARKNIMKLFAQEKTQVKSYLKANKVKFDSREDILRLADFLSGL